MRNLVLVPEALVVAGALALLVAGRARGRSRWWFPGAAAGLALVALVVELWVGATLATFFGGALVQDRFALFAKAAVLLAAALAIAVTDWTDENAPAVGMAMILLAAFGVMVIASAGDFVGLWAGLEVAAAAGVVLVSLRRSDLGLRLLVAGGVASALLLIGLAFVYATTGTADLQAARHAAATTGATLPFGIPVLVSATYIFLFILFGSFLEHAGMIALFNNVALGFVGHARGGPAKVAVISSGMMMCSISMNVATMNPARTIQ